MTSSPNQVGTMQSEQQTYWRVLIMVAAFGLLLGIVHLLCLTCFGLSSLLTLFMSAPPRGSVPHRDEEYILVIITLWLTTLLAAVLAAEIVAAGGLLRR